MGIQLFTPKFRIEECLNEMRECLEKGWTGLGYKTVEFEDAWKAYTGHAHAHFLSSNTVGLHLALHAFKTEYGWADDAEVITTPLTFVSTNHAILYAGLVPVFADVDAHLCLDPNSVLKRITPKTKAILFVGMGGSTGQYEKILKICQKRKIKLVLDAAHMAGTRLHGAHAGLDADVVIYSFQAVKNLPTADSGMICFKDAHFDERVRKLTWLGINKDTYSRTASQGAYKWMYEVEELGFKYHGNSIMAALALVGLRYLDQDNAYRRQLANWYRQHLEGVPEIGLIPQAAACESSTHLFQIRVENRDTMMLALNKNDIYPGVHYRDNTEYRMYSYARGSCPKAAQASAEVISLPMHMDMTASDVRLICDTLKSVLKQTRA